MSLSNIAFAAGIVIVSWVITVRKKRARIGLTWIDGFANGGSLINLAWQVALLVLGIN